MSFVKGLRVASRPTMGLRCAAGSCRDRGERRHATRKSLFRGRARHRPFTVHDGLVRGRVRRPRIPHAQIVTKKNSGATHLDAGLTHLDAGLTHLDAGLTHLDVGVFAASAQDESRDAGLAPRALT